MKLLKLLTLCLVVFFAMGCDNEEEAPAFFAFEEFTFVNNPNGPINQGSIRHNIPAAKIALRPVEGEGFSDDLGIQNIPSQFPYLGSGEKIITILPNVPFSGSSTDIDDHPHIEPIVFDGFQVEELQTYNLPLTFQYKDDNEIEFLFNETFDLSNHIFLDFATDSMQGTFVNSIANVYEGSASGQICLGEGKSLETIVATLESYTLMGEKSPFIEFDINTDVLVSFGLITDTDEFIQIGGSFDTEGQWKKFYYPIRGFVNDAVLAGAENFQIYWAAGVEPDIPVPSIFIDNVKLIQGK